MTNANSLTGATSFYDPIDESHRQALLEKYIDFLNTRNGGIDANSGTLPHRETSLNQMNASELRFRGQINQNVFSQLNARFEANAPGLTPEMLLLLAFCKINAGEAYGVEVLRPVYTRRIDQETQALLQVSLYALEEEQYHTRILVGAARHFDIQVPATYTPKLALKILIHSMVYTPKNLFHPILFGAEVSGIYMFNWLMLALKKYIPNQPELVEALEQRLIEIMIDEVGHITFNRLVMGNSQRALGRFLARQTVQTHPQMTTELSAMEYAPARDKDFERFDYLSLPEEVRQRSFFA